MADESGADGSPELTALAQVMVSLAMLPKRFSERVPLKDLEAEILLLIYKQDRVGSARDMLTRVRGIASIVRDHFSADTWSILNKLHIDARSRPRRIPLADALTLLNTLVLDLGAFSGMEMENMTRGHGWRFLDIGRRLERATHLVKLLRASLSAEVKTSSVLEPILEIADSVMTYRRRYFAGVQLPTALDLLLMDEGNPRALAFQLKALMEHAAHLPRETHAAAQTNEQKVIASITSHLHSVDLMALSQLREAGTAEPLDSFLANFMSEFGVLSNQLTHHYFSHTVASVS